MMWEYMGSHNGGWGGMGLGTVGMSLFWFLTIVAILATLKPYASAIFQAVEVRI